MLGPIAPLALLLLGQWASPAQSAPTIRQTIKAAVPSSTFDDFVHQAAYPRAASNGAVCAVPPHGSTLQHFFDDEPTETQAGLYRDAARRQFILAFPGSKELQDWVRDGFALRQDYAEAVGVECPGCTVHAGFLDAWVAVMPEVRRVMGAAMADPANEGFTTVIAGHSLGGALATLAYGSLAPPGPEGIQVVGLYTYGQPRTGNQAFADYIDRLSGATEDGVEGVYRRVTHGDDPVPQLPPGFGYVHSRTEYWVEGDADGNPTLETSFRCFGQEPEDCSKTKDGNLFDVFSDIGDHTSYPGFEFTCG